MDSDHDSVGPLRDRVRARIAALPPREHLMALRAIERHDFEIELDDGSVRFVIAGILVVDVPVGDASSRSCAGRD